MLFCAAYFFFIITIPIYVLLPIIKPIITIIVPLHYHDAHHSIVKVIYTRITYDNYFIFIFIFNYIHHSIVKLNHNIPH